MKYKSYWKRVAVCDAGHNWLFLITSHFMTNTQRDVYSWSWNFTRHFPGLAVAVSVVMLDGFSYWARHWAFECFFFFNHPFSYWPHIRNLGVFNTWTHAWFVEPSQVSGAPQEPYPEQYESHPRSPALAVPLSTSGICPFGKPKCTEDVQYMLKPANISVLTVSAVPSPVIKRCFLQSPAL